MSTVMRGARNAFRNTIRTGGVTIILALSVGLALVMFLSLKAVQSRIQSVQSSIGNDITISPAGYSGFSDVNNALISSELSKVSSLAHITKVTETLTDRVTTIGSSAPTFGRDNSNSSTAGTTSLSSPVKLNAGGSGSGGNGPRLFISGGGQLPSNFSLPISVLGTTDPTTVDGSALTLTSGSQLSSTSSADNALISSTMASKNGLKVGSTFTAYNATIKVAGIFSSSTQGSGNTVVFSLPTLQALTSQPGDITAADATVDSLTNMTAATNEVKNALGSSADVSNSEENAQSAIAPLQNIKTIATYSLIGALAAGSVIIFLTMLMIVRERRREIGVLKAIGASNVKIVVQFVSEALTLTLAGAVIGTIGGLILANPILSLLVTSNSTTTSGGGGGRFGGGGGGGEGFRSFTGGGGFGRAIGGGINGARAGLNTLHTVVGYEVLLYGLAAAVIIAIIGSALPAFAIAKVRPAEVLRGE